MMKKFLRGSLFVFSLAAAVLTSCSDDSDDDGSPAVPGTVDAPAGKIVAKIGGATFESVGEAAITNGTIVIGGNVNNENISIIVSKAATVGTYDAVGTPAGTTPDAQIGYTPDRNALKPFYSSLFTEKGKKVGTVIITEIDEKNKTISGTFSTNARTQDGSASIEITSGSFNKIPYTNQDLGGTMSAKIGSTAYTATVVVGASAQGVIVVNGQAVNGSKILLLSFSSSIKAGTYTIGDLVSGTYVMYTEGTTKSTLSTKGTLIITGHDTVTKRIEGTFSCDAADILGGNPFKITEGKFAVTYK